MTQDTEQEAIETCHCGDPATFRWHDGKWTSGRLCLDHAREKLDERARFSEYREEVTTKENMTTIGNGRTRIVPAGARPINGPWATIRTKEALDEWVDEHPRVVND